MITAPVFLLIALFYAKAHKGSDWLGILIGIGFGASLGAGPIRDFVLAANDAAHGLFVELLNAIGQRLGGGTTAPAGPTPANGMIALRYNLGLIGIGR
jgi:hypothetical protein